MLVHSIQSGVAPAAGASTNTRRSPEQRPLASKSNIPIPFQELLQPYPNVLGNHTHRSTCRHYLEQEGLHLFRSLQGSSFQVYAAVPKRKDLQGGTRAGVAVHR